LFFVAEIGDVMKTFYLDETEEQKEAMPYQVRSRDDTGVTSP